MHSGPHKKMRGGGRSPVLVAILLCATYVGTVEGQSQYLLEIRVNGYSNPSQFRPFCDNRGCFFNNPRCCDQPDPVQQPCTVGGRCDSVFFYCLRTFGTSRTLLGCSYNGSRLSNVNTDDASLDFSNATVLGLDNPLVLQGLTTTWNGVQLFIAVIDQDPSGRQLIDGITEDIDISRPVGQPSGNITLTGLGFVTMEVSITVLCVPGFTGARCENIDDCIGQNCSGNGRCIDGMNSFTCECNAGFTGANCEVDIDECQPNPCENGRCTDGINSFTCDCDPGFTGAVCDVNINDCLPANPCSPDSQCVDGINNFTCNCSAGFSGRLCDVNIDDCSSDPCGVGGQCEDGIDSFTCSCDPGFTGEACQTNIDDCVGVNCSGNGECLDGISTYTCECFPSHTGELCDVRVGLDFNSQGSIQPGPIVGGVIGALVCLILLIVITVLVVVTLTRHRSQKGKGNDQHGVLPRDNPVYGRGNTATTFVNHHSAPLHQTTPNRRRAESSPAHELDNPIYGDDDDDIPGNIYADPDMENQNVGIGIGNGSVNYHNFENPIYGDEAGGSGRIESTYSAVSAEYAASVEESTEFQYENINHRQLLNESQQILYDSVSH